MSAAGCRKKPILGVYSNPHTPKTLKDKKNHVKKVLCGGDWARTTKKCFRGGVSAFALQILLNSCKKINEPIHITDRLK